MCPPVPEIDEYWTDEAVFRSLANIKKGCPLPLNVTSDVNPYQFRPSDLSADMWYFCSGAKTSAEYGFWLATGEACEVLLNSTVIGLRTTLQFYEGRPPAGQKTNWLMQEYRTNEKDPRALCRVFLADENILVQPELPSTNVDIENSIDLGPKQVSNGKSISGQISKNELLETNLDNATGPSVVATRSPNPYMENFPDIDYVLRGDYLELNDLVDPISRSSSSADSSCLTMTSEEYFDSMALLRELEDDNLDLEMKDSNVKFNVSASVKSKEVVIQPATLGSLRNDEDGKPSTDENDPSKVDHTALSEQQNRSNEVTSNGINPTSSPSSSEGTSKEEKRAHVRRAKRRKMMKYLCFMAF